MSLSTLISGFDAAEIRYEEAGYNYYGFTKAGGAWRILREKSDGTELRWAIGSSDFINAFNGRASLEYSLPNDLPRQ